MKARLALLSILLACVLSAAGCSKTSKAVAPQPPVVATASTFEYALQLWSQEGVYTVTRAEYADADGIVRPINYQAPLWVQMVTLKPGQRMYLRADITFTSMFAGSAQITAADFYRGDRVERPYGVPGTATVLIDQILQ